MGRELHNGRGGCENVTPMKRARGGRETVLAMLKGGHTKFWVVLCGSLKF